jgi:proline iminopeptidase
VSRSQYQARSAYDLKKAWGEGLVLKMVDDAGHSAKEPGTRKLLVEVCPGHLTDIILR